MMIVLNENNELVLVRIVMGWKVCMDYHKLNSWIERTISLCHP